MNVTFELRLVALLLLLTYFGASVCWRRRHGWRQHRADLESQRAFRRQWLPRALDASELAPRIEMVRHGHATRRCQTRHPGTRSRLLGAARQKVLDLSYFRDAATHLPSPPEH